MNRGVLIAGTATAFFVVGGGIAGALVALNIESDSTTNNSNKSQNAEAVSVNADKRKSNLNGWQKKDDSWYFYKNNEKQTQWIQDENSWYYLGSDGKMRTGWIKDKENWYYLNTNGTMATNTTIDGCYLNDKGLIESTPTTQKQDNTDNSKSSKANSKITIEEAKDLIYSSIDAKDKQFLISGQTNYVTEVTPNGGDFQAQKIYANLGIKENMYKFKANYNGSFFVGENSGTTYLFDAGGTGGCGFYILANGRRTQTWRVGGWHNPSYIKHSSNGEDWATL